ncbi:hypothetical protein B0T10DRAFT_531647 [Thelonectria olida]|uniref:Uncharacterized protein n=1 Tax=Thelonectria olida TaxID=1576542 RepID=A0A9P8VZT3_9HYPO|nr:hypothetical protein B0T10DRAFT_531647 [Thelonectria olida]
MSSTIVIMSPTELVSTALMMASVFGAAATSSPGGSSQIRLRDMSVTSRGDFEDLDRVVLGREVYLLRIDTSESAYDISYDAWNYLGFWKSATEDPQEGGAVLNNCKHLLDNGKLPLSAANGMDYVTSCLSQPQSSVADNYVLNNILDPVCEYGVDECCWLEVGNLPTCPNLKVENIQYGTGDVIVGDKLAS